MHTRTNYAVTEVLSLITVVIIASSAISVILFWAIPQLDVKKDSVRIDSTLTQFKTISKVIEDVSSGGVNASNLVDFVTDAGEVSIDSKGDRFIFYYSLVEGFDFNVSDLNNDDKTISIKIEKTPSSWGITSQDSFDLGIRYLNGLGAPEKRDFIGANPYRIVTINYPLVDAVKMDIIKTNNPLQNSIIGRIWLFDSGDISYKIGSSSGTYRFITENGGAISQYASGYLYYEPSFYSKDNSIVMKMIQLKPGDVQGGGGKGRYTFLIKSNANYVREIKVNTYAYFKMQIYGSNSEAWISYYMQEHGFKKFNSPYKDTLYLEGDGVFSLVQSVCDVKLVTIK
jgi:hypothetical protein